MSEPTMLPNEKPTINIPFEEYNDLMRRVGNLERGVTTRPRRITERTAQLREWEGKLVMGWVGAPYTINTGMPDELMMFKVKAIGKEKGAKPEEIEVPYLRFLNEAEPVTVKIIAQKATEIIKTQGRTNPRDPSTDKMLSSQIDLEVRMVNYVSTIQVTNGQFEGMEFEIDNRFLNL